MVMGDDSCSRSRGFVNWMDMIFLRLICCKKCIVCLKRPKINEKEAGVGPFFKKTYTFSPIYYFFEVDTGLTVKIFGHFLDVSYW